MSKRMRMTVLVAILIVVATLVFVFRPSPIPVEATAVRKGHLQEIVEQEGKTRMHDHFVLSATVGGKLRRIELDAGDPVRAGETVAWIDPAPIDPRQRAVLEARLQAALAMKQQADALAGRAQTEYRQAEVDLARGQELFKQAIISKQALDGAATLEQAALKQLQAAKAGATSAAFQVEEAKSALLVYQEDRSDSPDRNPVPCQRPHPEAHRAKRKSSCSRNAAHRDWPYSSPGGGCRLSDARRGPDQTGDAGADHRLGWGCADSSSRKNGGAGSVHKDFSAWSRGAESERDL